jgi:IMP dehydrogenase
MSNISYEYDDVFIKPRYSTVLSRKEVSTAVTLESKDSCHKITIDVPVISANMDTITESGMTKALAEAGAIGSLHRFMSIEENVSEFNKETKCFVSIGVNRDWKERAIALHNAGARFFIVDIAHGHSKMMKNSVRWLREQFGKDIFIMAGNVGTPEAVGDLDDWTVDAIKVGIGGGFVCETKNVTGVNTPMFSTIAECAKATDKPIIADGGARAYGDIAKALGAGASAVMSGYFFAGSPETPDRTRQYDPSTGSYKHIYRGMASKDAMNVIREQVNMPTPEGRTTETSEKPSVKFIVNEIAGGLRSAFSYVGARNFNEFQSKVIFGYRR